MTVLRILVVEDSPTARGLLVRMLDADPDIEVVGEAEDGAAGIEQCKRLRPDLVTMDIQMPVMDGVEATRRIMVETPTPVVMISSLDPSDVRRSMLGLDAGALAVLAKPAGPGSPRFERDCRELIATIKALAQVKLVRRWAKIPPYLAKHAHSSGDPKLVRIAVVGLVASTGGPNALRSILLGLPVDFATPIVIVQHIAAGFSQGLADWLRDTTQRPVRLAVDGEPLARGAVLVAPDNLHLEVGPERLSVSDAAPVDGFRPSGTRLFTSLAEHYGASAIGVILTGMGQDGVAGLARLRDAGGTVLAQDEESCDIFGMPGAALTAGVVTATTKLAEIPEKLVERIG